jgi:hypothetical protein
MLQRIDTEMSQGALTNWIHPHLNPSLMEGRGEQCRENLK